MRQLNDAMFFVFSETGTSVGSLTFRDGVLTGATREWNALGTSRR